jgi:hypothetical protein
VNRRLRAITLALMVAALLALLGAGGAVASDAPPTAVEPVTAALSDEAMMTRWAYPARTGLIRTQPSESGRVFGQLQIFTEDDLPNNYLLLERRRAGDEDWVRIRVPGRPNGRTGWVRRDALGAFHRVLTAITVDRKRLLVTVRLAGQVIFRAPVGIGAPSTPTPGGRFWIREKFTVKGGGSYGPRALGTSAYAPRLTGWPSGGVVGFHGTNRPGLVPGRPSHGCMRLRNRDVLRLYRLVGVGTPVYIR